MPVPDFLKEPLSMYEIAEQYWDLNYIPTSYVFSLLSLVSQDKLERNKCIELCKPEGQEEYLNYCRRPRRTIIEVLQDFHQSTSKLTIEILFELFSPIKSRCFSIASSCKNNLKTDQHNLNTLDQRNLKSLDQNNLTVERQSSRTLDLLVAVVKYYSKLKKPRLGLCSNWMKSLQPGDRVYGWIKKGTFVFPEDEKTPCILIGPGTGLAPFLSYILDRDASNTANADDLILFFGCRNENKDYHCREDLQRLEKEGKLMLVCAFSRDQERKIYVQHKIVEHQKLLWKLINDRKAMIFISGSSKNMPDNVKEAFVEVFQQAGGLEKQAAKDLLKNMENADRLQIEAW